MKSSGRHLKCGPLDFPPSFSNTSEISRRLQKTAGCLNSISLTRTANWGQVSECVPFSSPCWAEGGTRSALCDLLWVTEPWSLCPLVPERPENQPTLKTRPLGRPQTAPFQARREEQQLKPIEGASFTLAQGAECCNCVIKNKSTAGKPLHDIHIYSIFLSWRVMNSKAHWPKSPWQEVRHTGPLTRLSSRDPERWSRQWPAVRNYLWDDHILSALGDAEHQIRPTVLPFLPFDPKFYWHLQPRLLCGI